MIEAELPGSAGGSPAPADGRIWRSRGYLPHFDQPGMVQMITYRLADSLPRKVVDRLLAHSPRGPRERRYLERCLDECHGACFLREPRVARTVENNLLYFDEERYRVLAWVVMPNHVHLVIETKRAWPLPAIVHGWKSYTAKAANILLGRAGPFWQPEYYDRAIRDERHLAAAVAYAEGNPVKAGFVQWPGDWQFSSASAATRPTPGAGGPPALPGSGCRQSTLEYCP